MITQLGEIEVEPQPYADYRPLFETTPLNVTHVRVWPGETVSARVQGDEHRVYYVVSGEGVVELGSGTTPMSAGSGALIPIGTEHAITNTGTEPLDDVFFLVSVPERS